MLGRKVSHYRIGRQIGKGGMGEVHLAEDLDLGREVAIKFLPRELIEDHTARERFLVEARSAAALTHPNIVTIHEIGSYRRQTFIVMEYIPGITLEDRLAQIRKGTGNRPLRADEIDERLDISIQMCRGVEEAHAKGILHRDIKPKNVIIKEDGHVKILDFGLARIRGSKRLTAESVTLGTIHYLSPEQLQGHQPDRMMDLWALAVVNFELMTGHLPFRAGDIPTLMDAIIKKKPSRIPAGILPVELVSILNKGLRKIVSRRYRDIREVLVDLKKFQHLLRLGRITIKKEVSKRRGSLWPGQRMTDSEEYPKRT
jgi:serine/threonine-protein kinase